MATGTPTNWIPDRKVFAGGLGAVVAFFAVLGMRRWVGVEMDPETAMALVGLAGSAVAYWVPTSVRDRAARLDADLKDRFGTAQGSPQS